MHVPSIMHILAFTKRNLSCIVTISILFTIIILIAKKIVLIKCTNVKVSLQLGKRETTVRSNASPFCVCFFLVRLYFYFERVNSDNFTGFGFLYIICRHFSRPKLLTVFFSMHCSNLLCTPKKPTGLFSILVFSSDCLSDHDCRSTQCHAGEVPFCRSHTCECHRHGRDVSIIIFWTVSWDTTHC